MDRKTYKLLAAVVITLCSVSQTEHVRVPQHLELNMYYSILSHRANEVDNYGTYIAEHNVMLSNFKQLLPSYEYTFTLFYLSRYTIWF